MPNAPKRYQIKRYALPAPESGKPMTQKDWDRIRKERFNEREQMVLTALEVGKPRVKMQTPVSHHVLESINAYFIHRGLPYRIRKQVPGLDGHHTMVKVRV